MDARKKILLGNKDVLSRSLKDFYVDVNLSKDYKEILPYKYDNVFDLTKFYDQERNESRSFIIYGTIDSYYWDCNNIKITVYQSPNLDQENYLCQSHSIDVANKNMHFTNMYNKLTGKYIINNIPITFTGCSVYLKLETQHPINYAQCVIEQQLIFTTLTLNQTGEKIVEQLKYGLDEVVTDCDGNTIEVNNDFDFFYNKHWIKKNIEAFVDKSTIWIGNENTKSCELSNKPFRGRNVGIYNTGNYMFGEVMEIYQVNHEQPTGNVEENTPESPHYIAPFPSNGGCPIPAQCDFDFYIDYRPTGGNTSTTAPRDGVSAEYFPIDTLFMEGETISLKSLNTSPHWKFSGFGISHVGKGHYNIFATGNTSQLQIQRSSYVTTVMDEITPYSFTVTKNFVVCNNGIAMLTASTPVIEMITPNRNKYYVGEQVSFCIIQNISLITLPSSNESFRLTEFTINNIKQTIYPTQNTGCFSTTMNEDKALSLKYEQGNLLIVKQKFMSEIGGHPAYVNEPTLLFVGAFGTKNLLYDEKYGDQFKSAGCEAAFSKLECIPGTPMPDGNGGYTNFSIGWKVYQIRINGTPYPSGYISHSLYPPENLNYASKTFYYNSSTIFLDLHADAEVEVIWSKDNFIGTEYD